MARFAMVTPHVLYLKPKFNLSGSIISFQIFIKKKQLMKSLHFLFILLIFASCSDFEDPYSPVYENFPDTVVERIFLDRKGITEVHSDDFKLLGNPGTNVIHKGMKWITPLPDSLVGISSNDQLIWSMSRSTGEITSEYEFSGRGPGEYQTILQFIKYDSGFLLMDGLSKFIRYSESLELIDEQSVSGVHLLRNVSYHHPYLLYSVTNNEDYLLNIINLDDAEDDNTFFHRRIISLGLQPRAYNSSIVSMSNEGDIGVLSQNMPILFVYDNVYSDDLRQPRNIIRLVDDDLDVIGKPTRFSDSFGENLIENPAPTEFDPAGKTVGVTPLFQYMHYGKDFIIIKQVRGDKLLVLERDGHAITHKGSYRFIMEDDEFYSIASVYYENSTIYLGTADDKVLMIDIDSL